MKIDNNFESSSLIELNDLNNIQSDLKNMNGPRRSTRRRRQKDQLEVKVSSLDKLKDIKVKVSPK